MRVATVTVFAEQRFDRREKVFVGFVRDVRGVRDGRSGRTGRRFICRQPGQYRDGSGKATAGE
jgi:hypothetical protein